MPPHARPHAAPAKAPPPRSRIPRIPTRNDRAALHARITEEIIAWTRRKVPGRHVDMNRINMFVGAIRCQHGWYVKMTRLRPSLALAPFAAAIGPRWQAACIFAWGIPAYEITRALLDHRAGLLPRPKTDPTITTAPCAARVDRYTSYSWGRVMAHHQIELLAGIPYISWAQGAKDRFVRPSGQLTDIEP
ncbi:hypothetical protein [Palleronia abyssalis]|uniref:Uncharacterized protein n=1 Tax=Palleronia abyssalis TaxID=1501240 RepID=A0A2R8BZ60_9RHOB|nr:hypothetical protein [Palleronia abyssalis]SPJ25448.1 hypothetical protein PAA8504_03299 [Palleronia abyssalis]